MNWIPRIAVTPGEPAGIGPELCAAFAGGYPGAELVVIADPDLISQRLGPLGHAFHPEALPASGAGERRPGGVLVQPVALTVPSQPGVLDPRNAPYVLRTLTEACDGCLAGRFDALVTGPVHKGIINDAGLSFSGHTEFLAARCGGVQPVMMLAAPGLRVALATTHLPLAQVSSSLTAGLLERVARILYRDLQRLLGIAQPRILVAGLNPHAGEGGHLGREELEVIEPVLGRLRQAGMPLEGPYPADTLFTPPYLARADAVLAMYHDQGLPVLKHLGFGRAVNITLGLPIVRTSVDHGTALDLAGSGRGHAGSLLAALAAAVEMASRGRTGTDNRA